MPDATIIIPTYQSHTSLRLTLHSLHRQTHTGPIQIIVADGSGSDLTRRIVDECSSPLRSTTRRMKDLTYLDASDGIGKAHNIRRALPYAKADVIIILDDDDTTNPEFLEHMIPAVREHRFAGPRLNIHHHRNPPWAQTRRTPLQVHRLHEINGIPVVIGTGMGITRELFDHLGGFNPTMLRLEDMDLSLRASRTGVTPVFVPDAVVNYTYRSTLAGIYRQERDYGRWGVTLAAEHGLPMRPAREAAVRTIRTLTQVPDAIVSKAGRARLATQAGALHGHLAGWWHEHGRWYRCPICHQLDCESAACGEIMARGW